VKLGIDFGTTRTVVAAVDRGNYPLVSFEDPEGAVFDWFPSLVAVQGQKRVYGWEAWACQQDPTWTIVRSIKRVLDNSGPNTILQIADQHVPLIDVLREMAAALKEQLPREQHEVMLGVPANANSNQRFLTAEAFRAAGFDVIGLLNEPSAASIEFGHKSKVQGSLLVYDLGGGTFDASLVEVGARTHVVLATEGIPTLGGDDFDHILAEMTVGEEEREGLSQAELFRLFDECRVKKEALHPNSRKLTLELDNVREGWGSVSIPVSDYYDRCRPLMDETVHVVEDLLAKNPASDLEALYVTGGGSELPVVMRVLKETFGRRVRRSAHARSATAIGLAIQADVEAGYILRERFTRYFGVWREGDAGRRIIFDPLFPKATPLPGPGEAALEIRRQYFPVHNIGDFRYLECSHLSEDCQPTGDVTVWDEIRFPFDPSIREANGIPVSRSPVASSQHIEEKYTCDSSGTVIVTITNLTSSYTREYRLGRWASKAAAIAPGKRSSEPRKSKEAGRRKGHASGG
jgi:molecular chaperone DnaK (HSP70)